jgi:hypothetical protein
VCIAAIWYVGSSVQLREYLPNARGVAKNELLVQKRLYGELPQGVAGEPGIQVSRNLLYVKRSAGCGWRTAPCT